MALEMTSSIYDFVFAVPVNSQNNCTLASVGLKRRKKKCLPNQE